MITKINTKFDRKSSFRLKTTSCNQHWKGVNDQLYILIVGHLPILAASSVDDLLAWNHDEILSVMHRYPSCVTAYFAGHHHAGGYAVDDHGIHHVTFPGVVEVPDGEKCDSAIVDVYPDKIVIIGTGRVQDMTVQCPTL